MLILWMLSIRIVWLTQQYQTYVNEKLLDWHFPPSYDSFTERQQDRELELTPVPMVSSCYADIFTVVLVQEANRMGLRPMLDQSQMQVLGFGVSAPFLTCSWSGGVWTQRTVRVPVPLLVLFRSVWMRHNFAISSWNSGVSFVLW